MVNIQAVGMVVEEGKEKGGDNPQGDRQENPFAPAELIHEKQSSTRVKTGNQAGEGWASWVGRRKLRT